MTHPAIGFPAIRHYLRALMTEQAVDELPEALNASEFMAAVVCNTPHSPRLVQEGRLVVDVALDIDEHGRIMRIVVRHGDEVVREAADRAVRVLRFAPARRGGHAVPYRGYVITVGFCAAARHR